MAVHKRLNGISAVLREPQGPEDTPEELEEERYCAQELINLGTALLPNCRTL
jgi:SWI/SNF-related matrix-associated actin-dependent regulator of chromatin subfamily A member 5